MSERKPEMYCGECKQRVTAGLLVDIAPAATYLFQPCGHTAKVEIR